MELAIHQFSQFSNLPLKQFDMMESAVNVLDLHWNYLFVNKYVCKSLKLTAEELIGHNMWKTFPQLAASSDYKQLKKNMEKNKTTNLITISPLTGLRISIIGYKLNDCYFFSSAPANKQNLIDDLRKQMDR